MGIAVYAADGPTTNPCTQPSTAAVMSAQMSYGVTSPSVSPPLQLSAAVQKMETTVSNPAIGVEDLYRIAIDPCSSTEQLKGAWDSTKSTRVRKAVASNPNCDSATMCMAARLYIKEVIANPSFELLNLFDEDKFVKRVYDAYSDPQSFYTLRELSSIPNTKGDRINTARALLVSPNLRSVKILRDICTTLKGVEFSRELKDLEVLDNVKKVAAGNLGYFSLGTLSFLNDHGVISTDQISKALSQSPAPSQNCTPKGQYTKFVESNVGNYHLLFRYLYANRSNNIRDIVKSVRKDPELASDAYLDAYAALYRDFLLHDVTRSRSRSSSYGKRYGWRNSSSLGSDDFSHHISDLVWTTIATRNVSSGDYFSDLDLSAIYRDIARVGFDRDFGPYKCEIRFGNISETITGKNRVCEKLLELEDDKEFAFFVSSGIVWDEWYGKTEDNSLESRVVNRLHRINENLFKSGLEPLYNCSHLDSFPVIKVRQTNGLEYNEGLYLCSEEDSKGNKRQFPIGSGLIDSVEVAEMSVRGIS